MQGVYIIRNIVTGKYYVGSSVNIENRWAGHIKSLESNSHNNQYLQNAWNKYGKDNFVFEILEIVDNRDLLRDRETYYLQSMKCTDKDVGYNMIDNANIGLGVSASDEVRAKISCACSGIKNGHYGKAHSEETKQRISKLKKSKAEEIRLANIQKWIDEKHKCEICGIVMVSKYGSGRFCSKQCMQRHSSIIRQGVKHSDEHNRKVSESLRGKRFSEEHRQKISQNAKDRLSLAENNPMFGKVHSEETRLKISEGVKSSNCTSSRFLGHSHTAESRKRISDSLRISHQERRRRLSNEE